MTGTMTGRAAGLSTAGLSAAELMRLPVASAGLTPDFLTWLGAITPQQKLNLEAFLSDDYDLIKRVALQGRHLARGPRFIFDAELTCGALAEVRLQTDFHYECWMLATSASWRSPIVKAVADFARER